MPLSWNEIRHRAIAFSKEWKGDKITAPLVAVAKPTTRKRKA
jgi:hypothetical protein